MLCRKKPSPLRRRIRKYIAALLVIIVIGLIWFECAVKEQLTDVIIRQMETVCEQAVNEAVDKFLSENFDIGDKLVDLSYNNGTVSAITTNPSYVNSVKTAITKSAQENIDEICRSEGVSTHIGSFTGLVILTNAGPEVRMEVESVQTVSCEFESTFESAGLNQTVHHITMTVTVDLLVFNPFKISETITTSSTYEIAQSVIVGSVPNYGGVLSY